MWDKLPDPELTVKSAIAVASVPASMYVVPMWGAPISTFGLAALGTLMSYAWTQPEKSKQLLFFKSASVALFSVALVVVMPDLAGWNLRPESQPPMAFIIATFGRQIILGLKRAAPAAAQAIAAMFGRAGNYQGYDSSDERAEYYDDSDPRNSKKKPTDKPPEDY